MFLLHHICAVFKMTEPHHISVAGPSHGSTPALEYASESWRKPRYQRTVTAGDETAHAYPIVSPFYPAVRRFCGATALWTLPCVGQPRRVPARAFDAIVLTVWQRRGCPLSFRSGPQAVLASGAVPRSRRLHTDYSVGPGLKVRGASKISTAFVAAGSAGFPASAVNL